MRLARPAALIIALTALATSAFAGVGTPVPYSQLRQDFPQINTAIAAATESDLNGTFNRLSAQLTRSPINSIPVNGALPANFLRNMEATLIDLQEDLGSDQLGGLTSSQKLDILQVLRIYAIRRNLEFFQSAVFDTCPSFCPPGEEGYTCRNCVDNDTPLMNTMQETVTASKTLYAAVYTSIPEADRGTLTAPSALTVNNFVGAVETLAIVGGVESIDD